MNSKVVPARESALILRSVSEAGMSWVPSGSRHRHRFPAFDAIGKSVIDLSPQVSRTKTPNYPNTPNLSVVLSVFAGSQVDSRHTLKPRLLEYLGQSGLHSVYNLLRAIMACITLIER